jgi:hypothetical protein
MSKAYFRLASRKVVQQDRDIPGCVKPNAALPPMRKIFSHGSGRRI